MGSEKRKEFHGFLLFSFPHVENYFNPLKSSYPEFMLFGEAYFPEEIFCLNVPPQEPYDDIGINESFHFANLENDLLSRLRVLKQISAGDSFLFQQP
jgi:hypothetical protein